MMRVPPRSLPPFAALGALTPFLLTGCSADFSQSAQGASAGVRLSGIVHGGNQVVSGSHIFLYAAGTGGYGTTARSMLGTPGYVSTDSGGEFSITTDYTCQPGDQVYLLALGGNPGLTNPTANNAALAEMEALGACSLLQPTTHLVVNEVTTVTGVYALSGFMTSATSLASSGTTLAQTGVANAFLTAANLADSLGGTRTLTPAGNGKVPTAEINSLANSIANCVNSDGTGSACSTLFAATTPSGGTAPTDTLQALLNLAHNPGLNPATIYSISTAAAPFQPTLSSAPHDWSLAVQYSVDSGGMLAADASGNLWVSGQQNISLLSPAGAVLATHSIGLNSYSPLAVDSSNDVWFPAGSSASPSLAKMDTSATVRGSFTGGGLAAYTVDSLGFDSTGNVWTIGTSKATSGPTTNGFTKFSSTGTALSPSTGYVVAASTNAAEYVAGLFVNGSSIVGGTWVVNSSGTYTGSDTCGNVEAGWTSVDRNGNQWTYGNSPTTLSECDAAGTAVAHPTTSFQNAYGALVDGDNHIWYYTPDGTVAGAMAVDGTSLSPSGGYQSGLPGSPNYMTLDPSGNVWLSPENSTVVEFVGLAAPVITPLSAAVAAGKLGTRP